MSVEEDIGTPSIVTLPEKSVSKVPNIFNNVDFPDPDGPINKRISPLCTEIFRPFKDKYYCLLHELKSTNSEDNVQELELYGSPSVSIAKEDARWQAVSCATYSFKIDPDLFETTLKNKIEM